MNERAPFNPWENPQDKRIEDFNSISNQSGAIIISSDTLCLEGMQSLLLEAAEDNSRLQSPCILLSGIGILQASKSSKIKEYLTPILQSLMQKGSAANGRICVLRNEDAEQQPSASEECELRAYVFSHHRKMKQVVISQNKDFLSELRQLCKTESSASQGLPELVTLSVSESGQLANPFDSLYSSEAERIADEKHTAIAQRSEIYITLSGLKHPQSVDYLSHNKAAMLKTQSQLNVLVYKDQPLPHADVLIARAQEAPATVRFVYLNRNLPTTDAIVEALLQEESRLAGKCIALITDNVNAGARIVSQLGRSAIMLSLYSINRYGYLSNIDRTVIVQSQTKGSIPVEMRRAISQAVQTGDEDCVLRIARNARFGRDSLEHGIIAALRYGKDEYLEKLIKLADACSPVALNWWILDYSGFRKPSYLAENSLHFTLLKELIGKTVRRHGYQYPLERLKELNDVPAAAHSQFEELISLMEKGSASPRKKREEKIVCCDSESESPTQVAWTLLSKLSIPGISLHPEARLKFIIGMVFLKRIYDCPELDLSSIDNEGTRKSAFEAMRVFSENALEIHFERFIGSFSWAIREIADMVNLPVFISQLNRNDRRFLLLTLEVLSSPDGDFSASRFSNAEFSEMLSVLIRTKAESGYEAGCFYSNPDMSALLADLLVDGQDDIQEGQLVSICDMAVGSSNMLNALANKLQSTTKAVVQAFGQDINPATIGEAKMLAILAGRAPENYVARDAFKYDSFPDVSFRYIVGEPPILQSKLVKKSQMRDLDGMPKTSDSTWFFLLAGLAKLDEQGKMAIVQPGRSLFETSNDEVRKFLIENDLLEAIIQLPTRMGVAISIPLYVWIINKNKDKSRRGKVLLVDASACGGDMRKARGGMVRSRSLPEEGRNLILRAYSAFESNGEYTDGDKLRCISRVLPYEELGHREIRVKYTAQNGEVEYKTFSMPRNETPDVFVARDVLPVYPDAKLDSKRSKEFFDIQMPRYFYSIPEGETTEGHLTHQITSLSKRLGELHEELEARTRFYREQIETTQEKLDALLAIAAHIPWLDVGIRRSVTFPR